MAHRRTPQADADIDDIWDYIAIASGSADIAGRVVDAITERFLLLASHPNIGRSRDEDLRPGLRSFAFGEYVIFYRLEAEDVIILRVLHGGRNMETQFRP